MSSQPVATSSFRTSQFRPDAINRLQTRFEHSLDHGQLRRIEAKELLFAEGDTVSHVYKIETGVLALFRVLADGRRQVLEFAYPGDIVGLGVDNEYTMNAQAVKPTRVRCLSMAVLRHSAASDPDLAFKLYDTMARELAATRDLMLTTGQRSAMERVASFLLAFSRRNQRKGQNPANIDLPMTRADIGDFLGLTIETVSRTFTKLKLMRLIELPHSNEVKLLDINRLDDLAGGSR
jgi:CRP/FNR family transcriptional regulator